MQKLVSPRQVARALGASESSLKRWCDKGLLQTVRTAGGHRRIPVEAVFAFVRSTGRALHSPELLGLPTPGRLNTPTLADARQTILESLVAGRYELLRRTVFDLFLSGLGTAEVCDLALVPAFHQIGEEWGCGNVAVYQERRACELARRVVDELHTALPAPPANAPRAIGGTLSHDHYALPTAMVQLVLREAGWQAESCGTGLPASTIAQAVQELQPRLVWLSVSHVEVPAEFSADYELLAEATVDRGVPLVVGGRAMVEPLRQQLRYSAYCDNLRHLLGFLATQTAGPATESGAVGDIK